MQFSNEDEAFMRVALEQVRSLQCSVTYIINCYICVEHIVGSKSAGLRRGSCWVRFFQLLLGQEMGDVTR